LVSLGLAELEVVRLMEDASGAVVGETNEVDIEEEEAARSRNVQALA